MRATPLKQPSPHMSLKINAIDHIQVTVPPALEEAALHFYGSVLGLPAIEKPAPLAARGGAWFQVGSTQLHVSIEPAPQNETSKRHVCYLVDDLQTAKSQLEKAAFEIIDEETEPHGLRRFFVRDPAGNRVEIGQRP